MSTANKYIVVSADSSVTAAEDVSKFIMWHLSKICSTSTCYTYANIIRTYDTFSNDEERIAQFLNTIDCGMSFQNVFWIFLLTPIVHLDEQVGTHCDQQIWLRAGKIIGQLILKAASVKNQISFWAKSEAVTIESEQIMGMRIRKYGSDLEAFSSYVGSAERRCAQLNTNLLLKPYLPHNKEMILNSSNDRTGNTLIDVFSNNHAILDQIVTILEKHQISYDDIISNVKNDNKEVSTATYILEISISQKVRMEENS